MQRQCSRPALAVVSIALLLPAPALAEPRPGNATAISLTCTLAPGAISTACFVSDAPELGWMVLAAGVLLGPATGYMYGGLPGRGLAGTGIRAGFGAVGMVGVAMAFDESNDSPSGAIAFFAGGIGIAGSMIFDLAMVGRDVRDHNERLSTAATMPFPDFDPARVPRPRHGGPKTVGRVFDRYLYRDSLAGRDASDEQKSDALDAAIWSALVERYMTEDSIEATPEEIDGVLRAAHRGAPIPAAEAAELHEYARAAVRMWKLNRSLYRRYGGVVVYRELDPLEPVGAYESFLREMERRKVFVISNADLRVAFWQRFSAEPQQEIPPARVNFETPWWLQPSTDELR